MPKFPSREWIVALCEELNNSAAYAEAAKTWEGDFYFIIEPGGPVEKEVMLYMDLWHGKCREAHAVTNPDEKQPAFVMSAKYDSWVKVIKGELDPIKALMTRQLKLKGNMTAIMKSVKAAQELVACCVKVHTDW